MKNNELINTLKQANEQDNIVIVSEENVYTIHSVNTLEGSVLITIKPVDITKKNNNKEPNNYPIFNSNDNNSSSFDIEDAIDVFGNLNNF